MQRNALLLQTPHQLPVTAGVQPLIPETVARVADADAPSVNREAGEAAAAMREALGAETAREQRSSDAVGGAGKEHAPSMDRFWPSEHNGNNSIATGPPGASFRAWGPKTPTVSTLRPIGIRCARSAR
jgi:hypothetical protein